MTTPTNTTQASCNPLESISDTIALGVEDWSESRAMAWIYGIVKGWECTESHEHDEEDCGGDQALRVVADRFAWTPERVARLRALHRRWVDLETDTAPAEVPALPQFDGTKRYVDNCAHSWRYDPTQDAWVEYDRSGKRVLGMWNSDPGVIYPARAYHEVSRGATAFRLAVPSLTVQLPAPAPDLGGQ